MTPPQPDDADERLRASLEARLAQEEVEAGAEQVHRNSRSLAELLLEWSDAGHQVRIEVGSEGWSGVLVGAADHEAGGVAALRLGGERVEVELAAVTVVEPLPNRATDGASGGAWMPPSLVARLRWCMTQDPVPIVTIGGPGVEPMQGTVAAVSPSHVELARHLGGTVVAIARQAIGYVILPVAES